MLIMQDLCQVLKLDEDVHEKELIKEVLLDVFRMVKNFGIYQDNSKVILMEKHEKFCGCENLQPEMIERVGKYVKTTYITDDEGNGTIVYQKENEL